MSEFIKPMFNKNTNQFKRNTKINPITIINSSGALVTNYLYKSKAIQHSWWLERFLRFKHETSQP